MPDFTSLTRKARCYWALVLTVGLAGAALAIPGIARQNSLKAMLFSAVAIAVAGFKIRLPGVPATLSMNYVIILVALLNYDVGTAMVVALSSTLGQCLIHARVRPRWFQVVFSVAGVPLPVLAANLALHSTYLARSDSSGCAALLAASMAYFLTNTITVAGIIGLTTDTSLAQVWKTSYLWTSPQYLAGGAIAWVVHFLTKGLGFGALLIAAPPIYLLYRSYTTYLGRIQEQQDHLTDMAALHLRTIETLALAIDAKDDATAARPRRVQIYASAIGEELKLSTGEMHALNAAALLHNVGKLAVPEYIISKPGKLTPEEFEKMKVHPVVGAEILERANFPYPVVPIVRSHHEKFDGTGYPDGLAGEQIPIGARILAAVDCLDALASDRQYREALPLDDAMDLVARESGKAFDPRIVAILQRRLNELERKAKEHAVAAGFAPASPNGSDPALDNDFSRSIANARQEIQVLTEVMNDLGNSLRLDDTLALLSERLGKAVAHDTIAVWLIDNDSLVPRFVKGESHRLLSSLRIPSGQGISGWVAENNSPIVNGNPAVESGYLNDPRIVTPLRSALAIPLPSQEGVMGVLTLYSLHREAFTADHNRLLLAIAPKAAHAIGNSLRFERAESAADTDELTGLANARRLISHLSGQASRSARNGGSFAVLMMDLDGFKQANDRFGHLAGNRILQAIGRHLRKNTRAGDVVARIGGDEFVVVMTQPPEKVSEYIGQLEHIASRLQHEIQCDAAVSISVGMARYPEDGPDAETLLARADERMYESKRRKHKLPAARLQTADVADENPAAMTAFVN